jgi:hypothetical protein
MPTVSTYLNTRLISKIHISLDCALYTLHT